MNSQTIPHPGQKFGAWVLGDKNRLSTGKLGSIVAKEVEDSQIH
jgi:hypothetical protein